ncbi:MAG: hypothetical protein H7062_09990 [Candidatus Saccharimonas sp.]|nr:hypothetical protein [Planctomycetaceae bacterium]
MTSVIVLPVSCHPADSGDDLSRYDELSENGPLPENSDHDDGFFGERRGRDDVPF